MADNVIDLSIAHISMESRADVLSELTESANRFLQERFSGSDGFVHFRRTFTPFPEWPALFGHQLCVWRGQFWGYRVELVPADFQARTVRVTLTPFMPLTEHLAIASAIPAVVLMVGLLIYAIPIWNTWEDRRDPILLVLLPPFGVGLALFGLLWLLFRPLVALTTDKDRLKEEKSALIQGLRDQLIANASLNTEGSS